LFCRTIEVRPGRAQPGRWLCRLDRPGSLWIAPNNLSSVWICRKNLADGIKQASERRRRIDRPEELLHFRCARFSENQKLIFVAVLVPAAQCQAETLVLHGEIAAPVFDREFFGLDPALSELLIGNWILRGDRIRGGLSGGLSFVTLDRDFKRYEAYGLRLRLLVTADAS
jgi:hypothetical protein